MQKIIESEGIPMYYLEQSRQKQQHIVLFEMNGVTLQLHNKELWATFGVKTN